MSNSKQTIGVPNAAVGETFCKRLGDPLRGAA